MRPLLVAFFISCSALQIAANPVGKPVSICKDDTVPQLLTAETSEDIWMYKFKCAEGFSKAITDEGAPLESEVSAREAGLELVARQKGACVNAPTYCVSKVLCNQTTCQPPATTAPTSADCAYINTYLLAQSGTFLTDPYEYHEYQYSTCTYRWGNRRALGFLEYSYWDWGNVGKSVYTTCVTNFAGTIFARGGGYCTTSGGTTFFVQATRTGYALPFPYP